MFTYIKKFHLFCIRLLLKINIGMRLFILIFLAASVSLILAVQGIHALSMSKESLRSVYEAGMQPVQQLTEISNLMMNTRLQLQRALSEIHLQAQSTTANVIELDAELAKSVAEHIEGNINNINLYWAAYEALPRSRSAQTSAKTSEQILEQRFWASHHAYIEHALLPSSQALRQHNYAQTKLLEVKGQALYAQVMAALYALNQQHFKAAHESYSTSLNLYQNNRQFAIVAVLLAIFFMMWMGLLLTSSLVFPLKRAIIIFRRIANGKYDTTIRIHGADEFSEVMFELEKMQKKLGENENAIHQLAFYDPLTNLPNRRLLRERLQGALLLSERDKKYGAILMIDLDHFKTINDTLGHEMGDQFLIEIAQRIQACIRHSDSVARMGGDEFLILLHDLGAYHGQAQSHVAAVAEKVLQAIHQPFSLQGQLFHGSASIGISLFQGQSISIEELIKRADISMYQAKKIGRNTLYFYDPHIQANIEKRIAIETDLRSALQENQLKLYYQIQVKQEQVLGAEVLLRWNHPQHGLMLPDQFISIAEESGLIIPIGEWVLRCACQQLKSWENDPLRSQFELSVNVSACQFRQENFVTMVSDILQEFKINPHHLTLELTESLVLHDVVDTIGKMQALKRQGVHFSMDDFGTGYSSLAHLSNLPIQQLKIDRSFVRNICNKHNEAVIVQTIVGMAKNLGMQVIAEGVESEEQLQILRQFECHSYQGYLFGKPMPLNEFEKLVNQFYECHSI